MTDACAQVVSLGMVMQRGERLTVRVVIPPESDHHETFFLGEDGLVDVPGCLEVRQDDRTHDAVDGEGGAGRGNS